MFLKGFLLLRFSPAGFSQLLIVLTFHLISHIVNFERISIICLRLPPYEGILGTLSAELLSLTATNRFVFKQLVTICQFF